MNFNGFLYNPRELRLILEKEQNKRVFSGIRAGLCEENLKKLMYIK